MSNFYAVVTAGGSGSRFNAEKPKQYAQLAGIPVIRHSIVTLLSDARIRLIVVAVAPTDRVAAHLLGELVATGRVKVIGCGGETRAKTVRNALTAVAGNGAKPGDWVLVHDAARPGLKLDALQRLMHLDENNVVGGLLAIPLADTVKRAGRDHHASVEMTISREGLWLAQTPQMFRLQELTNALDACFADGAEPTDEAQAMEREGATPVLVPGARSNFKLTVQEDLDAMERLMGATMPRIRIGEGFDVHALVAGRKLIIGGVEIPHATGLAGHSDADVLLHAITDALLGAAGLGDIGKHFPDTDPKFKGADSKVLLKEAYERVKASGWELVNIDATIIAEKPKMAPHVGAMIETIALALGVEEDCINIKAKTSEKLGALGRQEGIAAQAVAMVSAKLG
jgi:2-C-methyl-D-erythritol 4-phosphate cytidylyltransferase/2-C-methyl-D-erythritol 2,4-cyclodiphosphate synthase